MTSPTGRNRRLSFGVGLALFGFFFQLFLPISLSAAAGPGVPNNVLEICAADGFVRIPLPAGDGAGSSAEKAGSYVESCNHCLLHAVPVLLVSRVDDLADRPFAGSGKLTFPKCDVNEETAPRAGFDARGPPGTGPVQATT